MVPGVARARTNPPQSPLGKGGGKNGGGRFRGFSLRYNPRLHSWTPSGSSPWHWRGAARGTPWGKENPHRPQLRRRESSPSPMARRWHGGSPVGNQCHIGRILAGAARNVVLLSLHALTDRSSQVSANRGILGDKAPSSVASSVAVRTHRVASALTPLDGETERSLHGETRRFLLGRLARSRSAPLGKGGGTSCRCRSTL